MVGSKLFPDYASLYPPNYNVEKYSFYVAAPSTIQNKYDI